MINCKYKSDLHCVDDGPAASYAGLLEIACAYAPSAVMD